MSDRTFKAIGLAVWLNFMIFFVVALAHGGDALDGKVVDGRYYVGGHGIYREVGHTFFVYSAVHAGVSMASILAALIIAVRRKRKPR